MNSVPPPKNPAAIPPEEAAAHWLAREDAGLSATEESEFESWLLADVRHARAWEEAEATWHAYDQLRHDGRAAEVTHELARRSHRRRWKRNLGIAAALGAAAAVAIVFLRPTSNPGTIERIEHRTLADGSTVDVGADTRLDVNFDATRRLVKLTHGVALFTVAKNPTKPFIVSTGAVDVQAVGTAFAVEADDRAVDVVVTEGRVSVDTAPSSSSPSTNSSRVAPVLVDSGSRLIVSLDSGTPQSLAPVALSPDQLTRQLAWREPRIRLSGTRLRDAAALFNQVNGLQIEIADRELGDMRLDGVFRADDPEGFIRLLANYDIQVRRENDRAELSRR